MAHQVLLFYKYVAIEDPVALMNEIRSAAKAHHLLGRILVAEEGINGTVEGTPADTEAFAEVLLSDERFSDMQIKRSEGTGDAFRKLYVKVRNEIVGTRFDKAIDPRTQTGKRLSAEELKQWYEEQRDFVVVDMRNDYEYKSGHFKDSINPELQNSRDLPGALPKLEPLKDKTVLTVCTGGVRCEKMSAFLMAHGFKDVYQLDNGIHGYMEKYPGQDFEGTLYTFDTRKVMDFGGDRQIIGRCLLCDAPTENYVNCGNDFCHLHFLACEACASDERTYCSATCRETVLA